MNADEEREKSYLSPRKLIDSKVEKFRSKRVRREYNVYLRVYQKGDLSCPIIELVETIYPKEKWKDPKEKKIVYSLNNLSRIIENAKLELRRLENLG